MQNKFRENNQIIQWIKKKKYFFNNTAKVQGTKRRFSAIC